MKNFKLQSAMEYLMTYGWAILIIAIVMVALFSLGILGGSPLGTSCLAQSGYICQTPIAHAGNFIVTIGQSTGNEWTGVNVIWVPQGTVAPGTSGLTSTGICGAYTSSTTWNAMSFVPGGAYGNGFTCATTVNGILQNGQTVSATFPFNGAAPAVGTSAAGQIWAYYQLSSPGGTWYSSQLATVTVKTT